VKILTALAWNAASAATPARSPARAWCTRTYPGTRPASALPPPAGCPRFEARTCLACDPAPCAAACPRRLFAAPGGGVVVRKKLCIRCGECAKACPVDAVYLAVDGDPFVCIHCGRCVPSAPMTAWSTKKCRDPTYRRKNAEVIHDSRSFPRDAGRPEFRPGRNPHP